MLYNEVINMKVAIVVLIKNNTFLIARRTQKYQGYYEFPGGKIEPGESPLNAIKREVIEELNLDLNEFEFLFQMNNIIDQKLYELFVYMCRVDDSSIISNVHDDLKWVTPDELDQYQVFDNVIRIIEYMQKSHYIK